MKRLLLSVAIFGGMSLATTAQPAAGNYSGLFFETNTVSPRTSGSLTITVAAGGAFSAKLQLGSARTSMSGRFNASSKTNLTLFPKNFPPLYLTLDGSQQTNRIVGSVSDGTWTAPLTATRTIFDGKTLLAPQMGKYTLVIPGVDGSVNEPAGDGYGTVTVDKAGKIQLAGSLADGTKITQASSMSDNGNWPFYILLYKGQGSVLGWLAFTNQPETDLSGDVRWIKAATPAAKFYSSGFSNETSVIGSAYRQPGSGESILDIVGGAVAFEGGNLSQSISNGVILDANNHVRNLGGNPLTLTFTPAAGGFRGSIRSPDSLKSILFNGIVLQKGNAASGYFLGTNQSGSVRFTSAIEGLIQFQTIGSSFAPEVYFSGTPENFLWSWSDNTTSTNHPATSKNFGSAAARQQYLSVDPGGSLTSINLGFDGADGADAVPLTLRPQQNVGAVQFSQPLTGLQYWASSYNPITNGLYFTGFTSLIDVECFRCTNLKHVAVTNLPALKRICFEDCGLEELDLTGIPALEDVRAALNVFTNVVVAGGTGPEIWHWCTRNNPNITQNFQAMMTNFYSLRELWIWDDNQHGTLAPISPNLTSVKASDNYYTSADFTGQIHLQTCSLENNRLTNLVITGCVALQTLDAHNNELTTAALDQILLDLLACPNLQFVSLTNNAQLPSMLGYASYSALTNNGVTVLLDQLP